MNKPFVYHGPASGATLRLGKNNDEVLEVLLFDGQTVELPETHEYVQTLLALKRLTPVESKTKTAKAKE